MTTTWGQTTMTVFDPSATRRLETDTQSRAFVHSLVDTYRRMLETRVERILGALGTADAGDAADVADVAMALDAAHSLRVSSVMTGTVELAELSAGIVECLHEDDLAAARAGGRQLPAAADRAREALDDYLGQPAATQGSTDSIR
jgi:hypothetical protein